MFDAHNHLHFEEFDADRDAVVERARAAGVERMVLAGYDSVRRSLAAELVQTYPEILATAGLHPWAVGPETCDNELAELSSLDWAPFCAIGELGLDWVRATTEEERNLHLRVFREQLALARELELPVVIHSVKSHDDVAKWIRKDGLSPRGGLVHGFWGSRSQAVAFVELGLKLSIGTQLTWSQPDRMKSALQSVGLAALLVETDAPSRPPPSDRIDSDSPRNEPAYLTCVVEDLALVLGTSAEVVASATSRNARQLYEQDHDD